MEHETGISGEATAREALPPAGLLESADTATLSRRKLLAIGGAAGAAALLAPAWAQGGRKLAFSTRKTVTLTFWNKPTFADTIAEKKFWNMVAKNFRKKHPNVSLEVQWIPWAQGFAKETAAVKSGNVPDFTQTGSEEMVTFAAQGFVEPVDDVVKHFPAKLWGTPLQFYKYQGHYYGATYLNGCYIFYYRKDLLEKAGLSEPPTTWADWVSAAQKAQDPSKKLYGVGIDWSLGPGADQLFMGFMEAAGGHMLNKAGKVDVDTAANAAALKFYTDLGTKYQVLPPGITGLTQYVTTATPIDQWYLAGQLVSTSRWGIQAPAYKQGSADIFAKTGYTQLPAGPSGHSGAFMAANPFWIFKQSKNKGYAKEFMVWFQQPSIQSQLVQASGWLPSLNNIATPYDNQEWFKTTKAAMAHAVRSGWVYGANKYNGDAENDFYFGQAVQDVVIRHKTVADALAKLQSNYKAIYHQQ
jgi:multiple sugar transport system substrate-binding protein